MFAFEYQCQMFGQMPWSGYADNDTVFIVNWAYYAIEIVDLMSANFAGVCLLSLTARLLWTSKYWILFPFINCIWLWNMQPAPTAMFKSQTQPPLSEPTNNSVYRWTHIMGDKAADTKFSWQAKWRNFPLAPVLFKLFRYLSVIDSHSLPQWRAMSRPFSVLMSGCQLWTRRYRLNLNWIGKVVCQKITQKQCSSLYHIPNGKPPLQISKETSEKESFLRKAVTLQ